MALVHFPSPSLPLPVGWGPSGGAGEINIFAKNILQNDFNRTLAIISGSGKIEVHNYGALNGLIKNCGIFYLDAASNGPLPLGAGYGWISNSSKYYYDLTLAPNTPYIWNASALTAGAPPTTEYQYFPLGCNGQFNCFYGFVNIMTKSGLKQIQDLKRGDLVRTNDGFQPLAKLEVGPNPTQELLLKHLKTTEFMLKIPSDFFLPGVPNEDVYVTKGHPVSVKVLRQGDFEFLHLYMSELVSLGLEYVQLEEKYVYNLIFDKHYELNVGGIKFLSHHPNHNNENTRLEVPFDEKNRSKKVYADENGCHFQRTTLKKLIKEKPTGQTDLEFLGGVLQFTQVKQPLPDKIIHN